MRLIHLVGLSALLASAATPAAALKINLINTGGVTAGSNALKGFTAAAKYWEKTLTNNVTINLNVGFSLLGPNILGSTGSSNYSFLTSDGVLGLQQSAHSALDAIAVANLPTLDANGALKVITSGYATPGTKRGVDATTQVYDTDTNPTNVVCSSGNANDGCNNRRLVATEANLKALGFTGFNAAPDASITFSTAFDFDFAPTNGITAGTFDFISIAIHEIGHALGFTSGVDRYDTASATNFTNRVGQNSILDLFRYSADAGNLAPGGAALDWSVGTASYFSIDGGTPFVDDAGRIAYFSTGATRGDGRQASHWKDSAAGLPQLGILDPTAARGQLGEVTALDLAAYDAMGWNLRFDVLANPTYSMTTGQIYLTTVPEPATWALLIGGFALTGAAMRRKRVALAA